MLRSLILTIPLALLALTAARGHFRGHLVVGKSKLRRRAALPRG
jgi:hypothetical protein